MKISNKLHFNTRHALFVFLILLGAFLRFFMLGTVPGGMHQDESFVAWNSFALYHEGMDSAGHHMPIYVADWGDGHSALYCWLLIPLIALNKGAVTPFISRFPQAFIATLTLLAVYFLCKKIKGDSFALWSLFLLAICPWHIMMSRWGLDANLAPGFLIFGLVFFVYGLDNQRLFLVSAIFYGLALYSYAVIIPIIPIMLALQILYALYHKKARINIWTVGSAVIVVIFAIPLFLFLLVNNEIIPEVSLPFMTIPKMGGYRGDDVALSLGTMYQNLRTTLTLLWHQNLGAPYDIIQPWGLFYDIGRIFMIIGVFPLLYHTIRSVFKKEFTYDMFLLIPLIGGGIVCLLVSATMHRINALYIPLIFCETYGVRSLITLLLKKRATLAKYGQALIALLFTICLIGFQYTYYTSYRQLVSAYFCEGIEECVDFAIAQSEATGIKTISAEKAAQWPRLLLHTETLPSEYLSSVVYDVAPAPGMFQKGDLTIYTRINYENITDESIYIIYYTEADKFKDFELTRFYDWYVAVPVS